MARPEPPLQPIADHPTRQQLDELDALMQQMLALPVNPSEPAAPPLDTERGPNKTEKPAPSQIVQSQSAPPLLEIKIGPTEISTDSRRSEAEPMNIGAEIGTQPGPALSSAVPAAATGKECEVAEEGKQPPAGREVPRTRSVADNRLQLLVWINRVFDACMPGLGPLGRWLQAPFGRACLGWTGALLLAAALVWALLDAAGWTW
jgi:hypothetical protein